MMKKIFALAALLAFVAAPLALAHDGNGGPGTTTGVSPNTNCWTTQNPHDYVASGGLIVGTQSTGTTNVNPRPYVVDGNTCDIDGNGAPDDFDGDYEFGLGGGFFPAGVYAADPTCDYGLTAHHGPSFTVVSSVPAGFATPFTVGSDPLEPRLVPSTDPEDDDGFDCVTPGVVATALGGCVEEFVGSGTTTCLPGGDGGWWVWIDCVFVTTGDHIVLSVIPPDFQLVPPSGMYAECSLAGHISAL